MAMGGFDMALVMATSLDICTYFIGQQSWEIHIAVGDGRCPT